MENNGFDSSMNGLEAKQGTDSVGKNSSRKKRKYRSKWNNSLKGKALDGSEACGKSITDVNNAVREGTFDLMEQAITIAKRNQSLDDLDDIGLSNLHHAVRYNRVEAVASLLKHGAQVNRVTRDEENTPLHISSRYGWLEITKLLLEHGANPNVRNTIGTTPLHLACRRGNKQVVSAFLSAPTIQVNITDKCLMLPIHVAAIHGDHELCSMLMDKGADIEAEAADRMTPLLAAVANGNQATATSILEKVIQVSEDFDFIVKARDIDSNTLLHLAAMNNNLEIVERIVQYQGNVNIPTDNVVTPLHIAAGKGHFDMVKLLVSNGADIHARCFDGRTALHKAASFGHKDTVSFLLDKGAVVDARDYGNGTPFLVAVESGQTEIALFLLSKGAKIDVCDEMVRNCLHLAIENGQLDTLKALLEVQGCLENLYSPDIQERVPLHYAAICSNVKILRAVLTKQKRFAFQDENQQAPMYLAAEAGRVEHVEALGRAGSPINERDDEGKSALHAAAAKGHKKLCFKLIKLGADINYRDNDRSTPLMYASKNGCMKTCEMLLDNGAQIDDINSTGETALLEAVRYNQAVVVELLLDAGASVLIHNVETMGVIDVAVEWGSSEAVMTICKHPRWREVVEDKSDPSGHPPMKHLIAHFPEAAKIIMDHCFYPVAQMSTTHPDYAVQYEFTLLDPGPDDPASVQGNRYFGPETMVKHRQSDLLLHPLTQTLLQKKWKKIGLVLNFLNFITYFAFMMIYTIFLVLERDKANFEEFRSRNNTKSISSMYNLAGLTRSFPILIMIFAVVQMVKEIMQMIMQKCSYFQQPTNFLEWTLYGAVFVFVLPYEASPDWVNVYYGKTLLNNPYNIWLFAFYSIFLCYVNFILFLRRFSMPGLYITMHMEVMKTVVKVMMVFVIFILCFSVVFFILFKEQAEFKDLFRSIMKTTIMMLGEIDFSSVFIASIEEWSSSSIFEISRNPFPNTAFVFVFIFVFIMCIALMNLLVGLAVGDIDKVQREATLKSQAMQVEFVTQLADKFPWPRCIKRYAYNKSVVIYPNKIGPLKEWYRKLFGGTIDTQEDRVPPNGHDHAYQDLKSDLVKTKKRVKTIMITLEALNKFLKNSAKNNDPDI